VTVLFPEDWMPTTAKVTLGFFPMRNTPQPDGWHPENMAIWGGVSLISQNHSEERRRRAR
jgi:hypothetical protein